MHSIDWIIYSSFDMTPSTYRTSWPQVQLLCPSIVIFIIAFSVVSSFNIRKQWTEQKRLSRVCLCLFACLCMRVRVHVWKEWIKVDIRMERLVERTNKFTQILQNRKKVDRESALSTRLIGMQTEKRKRAVPRYKNIFDRLLFPSLILFTLSFNPKNIENLSQYVYISQKKFINRFLFLIAHTV